MESRVITHDELQTIVSSRSLYLLSIEKEENRFKLFIAYANPEETKYKIRLGIVYTKIEIPLYLCVLEIRGVQKVVENIPVEFDNPSIGDVTVSNEHLQIETDDGEGCIYLRLEHPEFRWKDCNQVVGLVEIERFLFVYVENVLIDQKLLRLDE